MSYLGQTITNPALVRKLFLQAKARQAATAAPRSPSLPAINIASRILSAAPMPAPTPTVAPTMAVAPVMSVAPTPAPAPVIMSGPSAVTSGGEPLSPNGAVQAVEEDVGETLQSRLASSPLPLIIIGLGALLLFNRKGR